MKPHITRKEGRWVVRNGRLGSRPLKRLLVSHERVIFRMARRVVAVLNGGI